MKITNLALSLLAGIGTGCTTVPPAPLVSMSDLPNCFDTNYDKERGLFTIRNDVGNAANQQCLLTVGPRGDVASASRLTAGSYTVYLANGGGGGAGGTLQVFAGGGGGGGGGAGAMEKQATVNLTEGVYKLTTGAGGPGGNAGELRPYGFGGGPGWAGSPSNMVRVATGEVVMGTPGADTYARPTRAQNEGMGGKMDGHGGSGPGQASGGRGGSNETKDRVKVEAQPGASMLASGTSGLGGAPGSWDSGTLTVTASRSSGLGGAPGSVSVDDDNRSGVGGGGGATSMAHGGGGGGEIPGQKDLAPERGSLGSGGGGGEGSTSQCDPGARGGHGYIALRPIFDPAYAVSLKHSVVLVLAPKE